MAGKRHRERGTATVSRSNGRGALRAMAEAGSNSYARLGTCPSCSASGQASLRTRAPKGAWPSSPSSDGHSRPSGGEPLQAIEAMT